MTRYFYDCEFIDDGTMIDLISIGIVREDGREFYAQNLDCRFHKASEWVRKNVYPHLSRFDVEKLQPIIEAEEEGGYGDWYGVGSLVQKLCYSQMTGTSVFDLSHPVELYGYYSAYDHVVLCQLFGPVVNLPKGMPMFTYDLKQMCNQLGNPKLPEQGKDEHHALLDARWNYRVYNFLERHAKLDNSRAIVRTAHELARLYARIPYLRRNSGSAVLTPEYMVQQAIDYTLGSLMRFCPGYGATQEEEGPHLWNSDACRVPNFEARCGEHPDRRHADRRRP
jgi:hypothetical protein